ncbi:hypothetical protein EB74_32670 [Mycobacterium sp. SWH-M5]|nr:hypothetical protein EB74_32670 [Mycobacterium sp. SWH-M5]
MSWDVVGKAAESVLNNAIGSLSKLGPALPMSPAPGSDGSGGVDGREYSGGGGSFAPPASPAPEGPGEPAPSPGPAAPPAPPTPPVPPGEAQGPAAEAEKEEARRVGEMLEQLVELDKAGISAEEVAAAGEVGRQELENIRADVTAEIEKRKADGSLYTVDGQKALMDFVKTRLEEARGIIEKAAADADRKAAESQEHANRYNDVEGGGAAGGGGAPPAEADATDAAAQEDSAENAQTSPAGMLGQPGMGMGMPMGGVPGFGGLPGFGGGGGGLPGFGGGGGGLPTGFMEPLASTLAGFNDQKPGEELGTQFDDDKPGVEDETKPEFSEADTSESEAEKDETPDEDEESAQTQAAAADAGAQAETVEPPTKATDVLLPDESVAEARTAQGAAAVRAALNGAPVAEAWQQAAGITLPPAGTPVTDPVPPTQLKAGDVGMWRDHMVMALGSGKVLVSGQVQPLESVSSGPDFLGWFDPTATKAGAAAPAAD